MRQTQPSLSSQQPTEDRISRWAWRLRPRRPAQDCRRGLPLALLLLVSLGACRSAPPEASATAAATAAADQGEAASLGTEGAAGATRAGSGAVDSAGAEAAIRAALAKIQAKGSYRVTMTTAGVSTQAEVQLPDRLRIVAQGLGQVVVIGPHTYSEQAGQWSRIGTAASLGNSLGQFLPDLDGLVQNARGQGDEDIDGQSCTVYTFDSEQDLGSGKVKARVTLWIDKASGLPRRQTVSSQDPGLNLSMTSDFSYPADIRIEAPATFTDLESERGGPLKTAPDAAGTAGAAPTP